jgi:hypothetical protein
LIENRIEYVCFCLVLGIVTCIGGRAESSVEPFSTASTVVTVDLRTGRLLRSVVVSRKTISARRIDPSSPAQASATPAVDDLVNQAAQSYNLDPLLVHSVIQVESNYNPYAISNKGAEGLMQLIPSTARRFGVKNSFNAKENIDGGVRYLKYLKNMFGDDRLALAAYHAGEGAVAKYGWIPPYADTQEYVFRVGKKYGDARRAAGRKLASAVPATPVEEHPKLEEYQDDQGRVYLRTR